MEERILDVRITNTTYDELAKKIYKDFVSNSKIFIVAINPEKILRAQNDKYLKKIINSATYNIADGIGIIYSSRFLKGKISNRITGIDLMNNICFSAKKYGYKIFLYGSSIENVTMTKKELEKKYPKIKIVGAESGYTKDNDNLIMKINNSGANVIFVGLGTPKQEYWIYENKDKLNANIFMGVGGSFDVISGKIKRAPLFMRKLGLEWLYRLLKEPKRIVRQTKLLKYIYLIIKSRKKE